MLFFFGSFFSLHYFTPFSLFFFFVQFEEESGEEREKSFSRTRARVHQNHAAALHARPSETVGLRARCETKPEQRGRERANKKKKRARQNRRADWLLHLSSLFRVAALSFFLVFFFTASHVAR